MGDEPGAQPKTEPPARDERALAHRRDRALVRRLKAGEAAAFEEMVRTYQDRVFGLLFRMLGNRHEAEDLAQEVFLSVHRHIQNYRGEGRLYTWLYRIAANTCRNRIKYLKGRHMNTRVPIEAGAEPSSERSGAIMPLQSHVPGPEATVEANRLEDAVARELGALEEDHRLLIVLRDVEGMSYDDIIRITGLAQGTVKSRLHRARVALKERLKPYLS